MQTVDEDADIGRRALDQPQGGPEIGHHRPGKELQRDAKTACRRKLGERAEPVGQPGQIGIIGGGDHLGSAKLRPRVEEGLQPGWVGLGRELDEFDVMHPQTGFAQRGAGGAPHCRIRHQWVAGAGVGHRDQSQADGIEPGLGSGTDQLRRRQLDGGQMREREQPAHGAAPAAWRPATKPKVSAGPRLMPPAG